MRHVLEDASLIIEKTIFGHWPTYDDAERRNVLPNIVSVFCDQRSILQCLTVSQLPHKQVKTILTFHDFVAFHLGSVKINPLHLMVIMAAAACTVVLLTNPPIAESTDIFRSSSEMIDQELVRREGCKIRPHDATPILTHPGHMKSA